MFRPLIVAQLALVAALACGFATACKQTAPCPCSTQSKTQVDPPTQTREDAQPPNSSPTTSGQPDETAAATSRSDVEPKPSAAGTVVTDADAPTNADELNSDAAGPNTIVIAYYFHRTMRCPTCLSIEAQARDAINEGYADALASDRLEWRPVNVEEEGNAHFESEFDLSGSSLVIVEMHDDRVARWKNLERVWELVEDPLAFQEYVWSELVQYLPG